MWKMLLCGAMAIALAAPAAAQDQCVAPTAPAIPDGARSTKAQITKALEEVKAFVTASDEYQACMLRQITANLQDRWAAAPSEDFSRFGIRSDQRL